MKSSWFRSVCFVYFLFLIFLGFYRGVIPGVTGSLVTGATYFGFIESTKKWIEESHPSLGGHWAHFLSGGMGKCFWHWMFLSFNHRCVVDKKVACWRHVVGNMLFYWAPASKNEHHNLIACELKKCKICAVDLWLIDEV